MNTVCARIRPRQDMGGRLWLRRRCGVWCGAVVVAGSGGVIGALSQELLKRARLDRHPLVQNPRLGAWTVKKQEPKDAPL